MPKAHKFRQYFVVAKNIHACQEDASKLEIERLKRLAYMIADDLSDTDPQFDRDGFLEAAGVFVPVERVA
jgi:hypothetical protein